MRPTVWYRLRLDICLSTSEKERRLSLCHIFVDVKVFLLIIPDTALCQSFITVTGTNCSFTSIAISK